MKAVRGSNRAATKAPRKQTQEKAKKTTGKRAAIDQVKCPGAVQFLNFSVTFSLVLWCLTLFHVQESDLGEDGAQSQQKPAKPSTGEFPSTGWLWMCTFYWRASCCRSQRSGKLAADLKKLHNWSGEHYRSGNTVSVERNQQTILL